MNDVLPPWQIGGSVYLGVHKTKFKFDCDVVVLVLEEEEEGKKAQNRSQSLCTDASVFHVIACEAE